MDIAQGISAKKIACQFQPHLKRTKVTPKMMPINERTERRPRLDTPRPERGTKGDKNPAKKRRPLNEKEKDKVDYTVSLSGNIC